MFNNVAIDADYVGTRLDRYLRRLYPIITQGTIEKSLRNGLIKINNQRTKANHRIKEQDNLAIHQVIIDNYSSKNSERKKFTQDEKALSQKILNDYLIFSSDDIIIIDKPQRIAVQGGSKISLSIDSALEYINYDKKNSYKLVHRLDKNTSGLLIIAKNYSSARKITEAFKNNSISKTYIAILSGKLKTSQGEISNYIKKIGDKCCETNQAVEGSKRAHTYYKLLKSANNLSMVEYKPLTGRMHQLRLHSQLLDSPILGDIKYGGTKHKRMFLHAFKIEIPKDIFGYKINATSELPKIFEKVIS